MKTTRTNKYIAIVLMMTSTLFACKKEKNGETPTPEPIKVEAITVEQLKGLAKDAAVTLPDGRMISGIVISDVDAKNTTATTLVLQEATGKPGIIVNLAAAHTFKMGDAVDVNISKQKLEKVNGEIVLSAIPVANAKKTGTGSVQAKETTAAELATNAAAWNGTLVKLAEGRFHGGSGKYANEVEFEDASGRVKLGILSGAAFNGQNYPASVNGLVGILRITGTNVHLDIRNADDVISGSVTRRIIEDFSDVSNLNPNSVDPKVFGFGFTTALGIWSRDMTLGNDGRFYQLPGNRFDAGFLDANREYIYMTSVSSTTEPWIANPLNCSFSNLKGLKTVTVVFAGSKMAGTDILSINHSNKESVAPFAEGTDTFEVKLMTSWIDDMIQISRTSPKFNKVGEWYTVTFEMPTKEEIMAEGISEEGANRWLNNPYFSIHNMSTRAALNAEYRAAPIVFDHIEMAFTN